MMQHDDNSFMNVLFMRFTIPFCSRLYVVASNCMSVNLLNLFDLYSSPLSNCRHFNFQLV